MAKFEQGILGPVSGKVGTVVGSSWRGIKYLRAKGTRANRAASIKQLQQQKRFALTMEFLRPITALLNNVFGKTTGKITGVNSATSFIIQNAITGNYPDYALDYSKVQLSRGGLPGAQKPVAAAVSGAVHFTWENNSGNGTALANDVPVLVVYCPDKKQAQYITTGSLRSTGMMDVDATPFRGLDVHTFISFMSGDSKQVSDSQYTGKLTIAA